MPDEDSHLAVHARSQAHDSRLKTAGMTKREDSSTPRFIGPMDRRASADPNLRVSAFRYAAIIVSTSTN